MVRQKHAREAAAAAAVTQQQPQQPNTQVDKAATDVWKSSAEQNTHM